MAAGYIKEYTYLLTYLLTMSHVVSETICALIVFSNTVTTSASLKQSLIVYFENCAIKDYLTSVRRSEHVELNMNAQKD